MEEQIRLNKYLSAVGFCSRRKADSLIEAGQVFVDGHQAYVGMKVFDGQEITVDGRPVINSNDEPILLLVNKPVGIVCTASKQERHNIVDYLHYPARVYPIGRLDKDSHGLILMTNIGSLHNEITKAANGHEKEYVVTVDKRIDVDFISQMAQGVYLSELQYKTRPAQVKKLSQRSFSIILKEGKNRQIRRMCSELSYRVKDLQRIRVMHFTLTGIEEGGYRPATKEEWETLLESVNEDGKRRTI